MTLGTSSQNTPGAGRCIQCGTASSPLPLTPASNAGAAWALVRWNPREPQPICTARKKLLTKPLGCECPRSCSIQERKRTGAMPKSVSNQIDLARLGSSTTRTRGPSRHESPAGRWEGSRAAFVPSIWRRRPAGPPQMVPTVATLRPVPNLKLALRLGLHGKPCRKVASASGQNETAGPTPRRTRRIPSHIWLGLIRSHSVNPLGIL